jgi:PAS domain S-box-containing protein
LRLRGDLKESQAYLGGIMAATTDALLVIDSNGRFVDANSAASTLFGTPRATLARMGIGDLPVLGPAWTAEERTRFVREGVWKGRMDLRRSDGGATLVDVRVSAVVLPDDTIYVAALRPAVDGRSLPLAGSLSASSAIRRPR